jgi:DNA-binding transcriptional MocR family regulator
MPAFDAFPMALWSRHVAKHWRARRDVVMGYGDARGYGPLRRAIAAHLRANRAIACDEAQVFIVNGAQHGFQLVGTLLLDAGDAVWFENPGAIGARNCFTAAGARLVPVPVDAEGLNVEEGVRRAPDFRLAFVTPAHQQPVGCTMSLARRLEGCNTAHNHPKGRLCVFAVAGGAGGDRPLLESGGPPGDLGDGLPAAVARRAHGRPVVRHPRKPKD